MTVNDGERKPSLVGFLHGQDPKEFACCDLYWKLAGRAFRQAHTKYRRQDMLVRVQMAGSFPPACKETPEITGAVDAIKGKIQRCGRFMLSRRRRRRRHQTMAKSCQEAF